LLTKAHVFVTVILPNLPFFLTPVVHKFSIGSFHVCPKLQVAKQHAPLLHSCCTQTWLSGIS
jgi:hypothetical protein